MKREDPPGVWYFGIIVVAAQEISPLAVGVGETIAGKFYVERVLGQGGMGDVVLALHTALGSRVAIKLMHPELTADAGLRLRFKAEAERGAQIRSEHVARVLDVGEIPSGVPYIVMEYVEGSDLGRLLNERGPLPVPLAVDYLLQACLAIAEAHSRGIVHRDIKPANLFVARRPDGTALVKVLDFGIAKTLRDGQAISRRLTNTRAILGSPFYAAPEQLESASNVDARSDIWALGVTLFELLTGRGPFDGSSQAAIIASVLSQEPVLLRQCRADLPEDLEWIVRRCLEKNPRHRFHRVSDLAERLAAHGGREAPSIALRISGIPGQERNETIAASTPSPLPKANLGVALSAPFATIVEAAVIPLAHAPRSDRRNYWVLAAIGAAFVLAATVVALLVANLVTEPPPLPPPYLPPPYPVARTLVVPNR